MTEAEFCALVENIREHGQRHPIITYQGMVLDGHHRMRACLELGKEPLLKEYGGNDPAGYVLSSNLHRRHLSASQRAGAIVACNEWRSNGDCSKLGNVAELFQTSAQLAETAQVSERLIVDAKAAHKAGFGEAMRDGETTASEAAALARKAPEVAARVVAKEITPAQGKEEMKEREAKPEKRSFAPPESQIVAKLMAEKEALEAEVSSLQTELLARELASVDKGRLNEAKDKLQGFVDGMAEAIRQREVAEASLNEAHFKNGELMRTNAALEAKLRKFEAKK
jgi:hypothetical protein